MQRSQIVLPTHQQGMGRRFYWLVVIIITVWRIPIKPRVFVQVFHVSCLIADYFQVSLEMSLITQRYNLIIFQLNRITRIILHFRNFIVFIQGFKIYLLQRNKGQYYNKYKQKQKAIYEHCNIPWLLHFFLLSFEHYLKPG